MNDLNMAAFTAPRTDQANYDDFIAGPRTIKITAVKANDGSKEQPISVYFEGDEGKPYKPCLSMRRVMVHVWGADARNYVGRSMTLYGDPKVQFGGMAVGGIRISHMSHIDKPQTMALTATRAKRAPFTVQPLQGAPVESPPTIADYEAASDAAALEALEDRRKRLWTKVPTDAKNALKAAADAARTRIMDTPAAEVAQS